MAICCSSFVNLRCSSSRIACFASSSSRFRATLLSSPVVALRRACSVEQRLFDGRQLECGLVVFQSPFRGLDPLLDVELGDDIGGRGAGLGLRAVSTQLLLDALAIAAAAVWPSRWLIRVTLISPPTASCSCL